MLLDDSAALHDGVNDQGRVPDSLDTAFATFGSFGSAPSTPGSYDEFALYDTALTSQQIAAHHGAAAPVLG